MMPPKFQLDMKYLTQKKLIKKRLCIHINIHGDPIRGKKGEILIYAICDIGPGDKAPFHFHYTVLPHRY